MRTAGELLEATTALPAWQEVMEPRLDLMQTMREWNGGRRTPGPKSGYTTHTWEAVEAFRRIVGASSYSQTRVVLTSDKGRHAREVLELLEARMAPTRGNPDRFSMPGVPSEAARSKYVRQVGNEARLAAWTDLLHRLRADYVAGAGEELRVVYIDGTHIRVRGTCPVYHPTTKELVNGERTNPRTGERIPSRITVPDGGYMKPWHHGKKGGHGFTAIVLCDEVGVPLAHRVAALPGDERGLGAECLHEYAERLRPHNRHAHLPGVVIGDSGFTGSRFRLAARQAGFIENVHGVSHGRSPTTTQRAAQYSAARWHIDGHPGWYADGHREISCVCGQATFTRRAWVDDHGVAKTSVRGRCPQHGTLNVTSGLWNRVQNPDGFELCNPGEYEDADLAFGNPLTYDDPMASIYGADRFARGEGLNGQLWTGYGVNRDKTRFRSRPEVELEVTITFALLVSLALQHRNLTAAQSGHTSSVPALSAS